MKGEKTAGRKSSLAVAERKVFIADYKERAGAGAAERSCPGGRAKLVGSDFFGPGKERKAGSLCFLGGLSKKEPGRNRGRCASVGLRRGGEELDWHRRREELAFSRFCC